MVLQINGLELQGRFFFANLLDKVDCFDFDSSVYTMDGEFIDKIESLVIDESKACNSPLIRLAKSCDVITLTRSDVAEAITDAGVSGVKFVEQRDWAW